MRGKRASRGETLVETLAAILVVSLTSVFLLTSVMSARKVNDQAGESDQRFRLEMEAVERHENAQSGKIKISTPRDGTSEYAVTVYGQDDALRGYELLPEGGAG